MMELLIAISVLGFALLSMILSNNYIQAASDRAHERMVAAQDSQRVLELIRNASTNGAFPANVVNTYPNGAAIPGFNNLVNEQIIANYSNTIADPLDITVTTTWLERGERNVSFQLRTLMTQRTNP